MSALLLASFLSPAASAVAVVGPSAHPCAAGDALADCVEAASFAHDQAQAAFARGDDASGLFWLDLASDALEVLP